MLFSQAALSGDSAGGAWGLLTFNLAAGFLPEIGKVVIEAFNFYECFEI